MPGQKFVLGFGIILSALLNTFCAELSDNSAELQVVNHRCVYVVLFQLHVSAFLKSHNQVITKYTRTDYLNKHIRIVFFQIAENSTLEKLELCTPTLGKKKELYTPKLGKKLELYTPKLGKNLELYTPKLGKKQELYTPKLGKKLELYTPN